MLAARRVRRSFETASGRLRVALWLLRGVYLAALIRTVIVDGVPIASDAMFLWLVLGLVVFTPRFWRRLPAIAVDWLPIVGLLLLYDLIRGWASVPASQAHLWPQIRVDQFLFGGQVPTVWLQNALYHPGHPRWYDFAVWSVYLTHFFAIWVTLAVLWRFNHARFRTLATMTVSVTMLGFLTYAVFPAVPPWLAGELGALPHVSRIVLGMWQHVGVHMATPLFENGAGFVNLVAALPSLHAAYPLLLTMFFWRSRWWVRAGLIAYTLAMAFSLVYGGEHYVTDVLLGWIYAVAVYFAVPAVQRAWRNARPATAGAPGPAPAPAPRPAPAPAPAPAAQPAPAQLAEHAR
jgi:membrane-associated phospholipid phosphatase